MTPFLREHVRPLLGSMVLHGLVAGAVAASAWLAFAPKVVPPAAIEAYLVARPSGRPSSPAPSAESPPAADPAPPSPAPTEAPATPPPPASPQVDVRAARAEAERAEQAVRERIERQQAERAQVVQRRREAAAAKAAKAAEVEQRRRAEEAKADQRRKLEAARADEQRRAALAEDRRRADADRRAHAQREADLAKELAVEQQRLGAQNSGLQARYVADLRARIERAWNRPASARPGIRCLVDVQQVPGGTVTDVSVGECNGDAAVVESIKLAVYKASPLPAPPDPTLFERRLRLVFSPDG